MRAIRSITSTRTFTSMGTTTTSVWTVRFRSCSCTTLASVVFVNNRLQEVIVNLVRGGQACGKQRREVQEGFLTQVRFLGDSSRRAFWRQHPYRNLETLPNWIDNRDRTVAPFGTTNDLQNSAAKRMKRIVNLDVRIFRAQGIVSADVFIRTCMLSWPAAASPRMGNDGFLAGLASSCQCAFCPVCSDVCFSQHWSDPSTAASSISSAL
jgi:hypothetical protein